MLAHNQNATEPNNPQDHHIQNNTVFRRLKTQHLPIPSFSNTVLVMMLSVNNARHSIHIHLLKERQTALFIK
jgi:hypothetical protein